ncbi:MAG: radical SAM protein [Candidatus Nanoarchaeia archaeon]|nr:radical SAM protein [Candidatus Nanoarchaeia archaeon]
MNIQTISIVVPTIGCVNKCKYCISLMHDNPDIKRVNDVQIEKRLKWAVMNGVNTCILTGSNGEVLQNKPFLLQLADIFKKMGYPFPNVELQTSGVLLSENLGLIRENIELLGFSLRVNTISLSVADIFDDRNNIDIIGTPKKLHFKLESLINLLKGMGFNIRLSINMSNLYHSKFPREILERCKELEADQITFRKLFAENNNSESSKWVRNNKCDDEFINEIERCIIGNNTLPGIGTPLYELPFGAIVYSVMGMSVVIDKNCMNKSSLQNLKYVILRENGKLYSQWDDEGSLIF